MDILDYMEYAEVRATLGINSQEVSNTQLGLSIYADALENALTSVSGTLSPDTSERDLSAQYAYLTGLAILTSDQVKLKNAIRLYAVYTVAELVAETISMAAPKTVTDGKALMTRFSSEATFNSVVKVVKARRSSVLHLIKDILSLAITVQVFVDTVVPSINTVTNDEYS